MSGDPIITVRIRVRDIMNNPIISSPPDETIADLASKMRAYEVGSVAIIDEHGEVAGIVTDGDVIQKVVAVNKRPSEVRAREVMSSPVETIDAESEITQAVRVMRKKGIKRLVVTRKGHVTGIVSMSDVLNVVPEVLDVLSEKARILSGEIVRRRKYVSGYCDMCGQWSDYLVEVDGKFLCEECRAELGKRGPQPL